MALAIFDLDETLVAGDTCSLFAEYLVEQQFAAPEYIEKDRQLMELYNSEKLVLSDYINFFIEPLSHLTTEQIDGLMPDFVQRYVAPRIYPEAHKLLAELKQAGHRTVIISATAEFVVRAVAHSLGVSDVLAIELQQDDAGYTGQIRGVPTFREGKVTRLHDWLEAEQESMDGACFYSDSINDLPLLEQVEYPMVTNPDDRLNAIAIQRGWPVINWTAPVTDLPKQNSENPLTRQEPTHV